MPMVYYELHRMARRHWGSQKPGHTLQPTVLIHEAFLKVAAHGEHKFQNRPHFFGVAQLAGFPEAQESSRLSGSNCSGRI